MKDVKVHLISAPWARPDFPSIQLGALKAFLDREFKGKIETKCYSAFFSIMYSLAGPAMQHRFFHFEKHGEWPYAFLYLNNLKKAKRPFWLEKTLAKYNRVSKRNSALNIEELLSLEHMTEEFVDKEVLPHLDANYSHVIGFTLNFNQVYSSLLVQRRIQQKSAGHKITFVFGGYGADSTQVEGIFSKLKIPGHFIRGEGEQSLKWLVEQIATETGQLNLPKVIGSAGKQVSQMADLPLPDFDEYFFRHRNAQKSDIIYKRVQEREPLPDSIMFEGTRGCFGKCDFCGLNSIWSGFRKMSAEEIFRRVVHLVHKHNARSIRFLDNVCDTWAEQFADLMISNGLKIPMFMELRAHHPEQFWIKLAAAGLQDAQIGIEALSDPLLKHISKGTKAVQNIAVLKYLAELKIYSGSNLITHHPLSTIADVSETRRIIEMTPHLPRLFVGPFRLVQDSPLYRKIGSTPDLVWQSDFRLSRELNTLVPTYNFESPAELRLSGDVSTAWDAFVIWYKKELLPKGHRNFPFYLYQTLKGTAIHDERFGTRSERLLTQLEFEIVSRCHRTVRRETLLNELTDSNAKAEQVLQGLIESKIILESSGLLLSLPLRKPPEKQLVSAAIKVL